MTRQPITRSVRITRALLVLGALAVCALPLLPGSGLSSVHGRMRGSFHLLPGLTVVALSLLFYFRAARRGALLRRDQRGRRLEALDIGLLLAFPLYLAFGGSGLADQSGDNISSRILPFQLVENGTFDLSTSPHMPAFERPHYSTVEVDGKLLSSWPIGTPLLSLPHAALAVWLNPGGITRWKIYFWASHFAALTMAACACLLFLGVRPRYGEAAGFAVALVFAFATTAMSTLSQGMMNFTGEIFGITLALALLLPEARQRWMPVIAGIALGFAFACRPTAVLAMGGLTLILFVRNARLAWPLACSAGATVIAIAAAQFAVFGHPLGGYGLIASEPGVWGANLGAGLAGNLLSPARGVLIWFPYLVVLVATTRFLQRRGVLDAWWAGSLCLIAANYFLISVFSHWWGGSSVGPRLMGESAPFLALATLPWWRSWNALGARRIAVLWALGIAAVCHTIAGHDLRVRSWHQRVAEPAGLHGIHLANQGPLWWWANGQLAAACKPVAPPAYELGPAWKQRPKNLVHVDLTHGANARYDLHAFRPRAPRDPRLSFPRLRPELLNNSDALFRFADVQAPNALTTFRRPAPPALPVTGWPTKRIHAVLTAGSLEPLEGTPVIAVWELTYVDGKREEIPIRLNVDAFPFRSDARGAAVPPQRVYAGEANGNDVLVHSSWKPKRQKVALRSLRLRCAQEFKGRDVGVCLLALSLELPEHDS